MALMAMGNDAIGPLVAALKDDFAPVREYSAQTLGKMCIKPSEVVPALIDALSDENMDVRVKASQALGLYKTDAKNAVPRLIEFASSIENSYRHNDLRQYSAEALEKIAPSEPVDSYASHVAKQAIDAITAGKVPQPETKNKTTKTVTDIDHKAGSARKDELSKLDLLAADTVPKLVVALADSAVEIRLMAIDKLAVTGNRAKPALLKAMSDKDASIGNGAAYCLSRGGPQVLANAITEISRVPPPQDMQKFQQNFTLLAGYIGPPTYPFVLQNLENQRARSILIAALPMLGPPPHEAHAALFKMVKGTRFDEKLEALRCLGRAAPGNVDVIATLSASLNGEPRVFR
jgi:HEAT repeat protein